MRYSHLHILCQLWFRCSVLYSMISRLVNMKLVQTLADAQKWYALRASSNEEAVSANTSYLLLYRRKEAAERTLGVLAKTEVAVARSGSSDGEIHTISSGVVAKMRWLSATTPVTHPEILHHDELAPHNH